MKTLLCIPTLNASCYVTKIIESIKQQDVVPTKVLVIDSSSTDGTVEVFQGEGFDVHSIRRSEFNHGATRNLAFAMNPWADIVVFQTQDALFESGHSLKELVRSFDEPAVGAAYGRQLPRIGAGPIEAHARVFNYPTTNQIRSLGDVNRLGFRSIFISNSFAAYRASAYRAVGGFSDKVIVGEDTHLVARLLLSGWKVAYCAEAKVYHSHDYSIRQEFSRYFDTGVFHARERWLRDEFGSARGEGIRFLKSEVAFLIRRSPWLLLNASIRTVAKYCGYQLGRREAWIPHSIKRRLLSMHRFYWEQSK